MYKEIHGKQGPDNTKYPYSVKINADHGCLMVENPSTHYLTTCE